MARNHASLTNGGWPAAPAAPDQDPRAQRGAAPGSRPYPPAGQNSPQTAPPGGYQHPQQGGYPQQQGYPQQPGYPPQAGYPAQPQDPAYEQPQQGSGYHYPQQRQPAPGAQFPDPRQSLSALGSGQPPQAAPQNDYPYGGARSPFGQQPAPQQPAQPRYGSPQVPAPAGNAPANFRQPAPGFGGQRRQPDPTAAAAGYEQWNLQQPDQHDYDLGNYLPSGETGLPHPEAGFRGPMDDPMSDHMGDPMLDPMHDPLQQQADWALPAIGYGDPTQDPSAAFEQTQLGYEHSQGGALEQAYADDGADYETEEPRRASWAMRIAGAVVVAIGLGYGLAQGYQLVMGGSAPEGATPVVESDSAPAKVKPLDPGGKQFAHTDSKVMGRLGEASPASDESDSEDGTRRVQTLVVGRDGSIQPPEEPAASESSGGDSSVAVPGVTMFDGFGGQPQYPQQQVVSTTAAAAQTPPQQPAAARSPVVVRPPPSEAPRVITASTTPSESSSSSESSGTEVAALPPKKPALPKRAPTSSAPSGPVADGSNGYVAVLASVPASGGSRLLALKKFADMQQQYGTVLQNKTPDVREANLGQKGIYHRLLVGPPGSRAQASAVCGELKQAGYNDCWVTAY